MPELTLAGCAPAPLAGYLKALAVLRLVSRQADAGARGRWRDDVFVLDGALGAGDLLAFFLDRYRPTPAVSPWNGGSGFHPRDHRAALERIERDGSDRLAGYREAIAAARAALAASAGAGGGGKDAKTALARRCRATFPDAALEWLDAALVLTADGLEYPRLLVSGGNDGRLDFSNNFMQRLCDVLPGLGADAGQSAAWLRAALLGEPAPPLRNAAVGMFNPGAAGGANASAGFEGASLVNPWDFVLTIEGVVLFAGAAARRLGAGGARAAFPFTVEPSTAGVASGASDRERARAEVWLPLWGTPSSLAEVEHLCAEGRAEWGRHQARDAVEFAEAVASLGVARGVDDFARYAIYQRMGNNHVATPVGRVHVRRRRESDLLAGVDWWVRRFRDRVGQDAPAALRERRRRLEQAVFELSLRGGARATIELLVELGRAELAAAAGDVEGVPPLTLERPHEWLRRCGGGRVVRLAAALGSLGAGTAMPLRSNLEPVALERGRPVRRPGRSQVLGPGGAGHGLAAVLRRRLLDAEMAGEPGQALRAARGARLDDVRALLAGEVSLDRVADLAVALSLADWPPAGGEGGAGAPSRPPRLPLPRAYALPKLCCLPFPLPLGDGEVPVPLEPGVFAALAAGRVDEALRRAAGRLRASGVRLHPAAASPELTGGPGHERLLAALLVPISRGEAAALAAPVSIPTESEVPA